MGNSPVISTPPPGDNLWHGILHSDARSGVRSWLDPVSAIALRCTSTLDLSDPHPDTWTITKLVEKLDHRIWDLLTSRNWYGLKRMDTNIRFQLVCFYYGHTTICTRTIDTIGAHCLAQDEPTCFGVGPVSTPRLPRWTGYGFIIVVACRHVHLVRHFLAVAWRHMVQMDAFLTEVGNAAIRKALSGTEYAATLHALLETNPMVIAIITANKRVYNEQPSHRIINAWFEWQRCFLTTGQMDEDQLVWCRHCWDAIDNIVQLDRIHS
jgi:hypothetical protein